MMRRVVLLAFVMGVAAIAAWIYFIPSRSGSVGTTAGLQPGDPSALTLYYSGERLSYLEPCGCDEALIGGFPRGHSVMLATAREGGAALVLENGDLNDDIEPQDRLKYGYQVRALGSITCAAYNIGELDLTLGLSFLKEAQAAASFPFISANLTDAAGGAPFVPSVEVTRSVGGVPRRIRVVGALADGFAPYAESADLLLRPAADAVREALRGGSADLTIVLFHGDLEEARRTLAGIGGIDLVIATCHENDAPFESAEPGGPVYIGNGLKGKIMGRLPIAFSEGSPEIGPAAPVTLTNLIPDSPTIVPILHEYYGKVAERGFIDDVAQKDPQEGGLYVGSDRCGECHEREYEIWKGTKHSHGLDTLIEKGREADPECVVCHVVGLGYVSGFSNAQKTPQLGGVGCENCHGVGGNHSADPKSGYGFISEPKQICLPCHNPENSPKFEFHTFWPQIEH